MATLYLIRGLPGSGKSTFARKLAQERDIKHFEADMFFELDGEYKFVPEDIHLAHRWCFKQIEHQILEVGNDCIVSNTFTTVKEMENYMALPGDKYVIEMLSQYESIHNVPEKTMDKMRARWVPNHKLPWQYWGVFYSTVY